MAAWRSDGKMNYPGTSGSSGGPSRHPPGIVTSSTSSSNNSGGMNPEYCETIVSMLSMLSCSDQASAHRAILAITNSPESCHALRKAGCIPLLIQILHPTNLPKESHPTMETKNRAARALKNIVIFNQDEKVKRNELRVLKLLESIRTYSEQLKTGKDEGEKHPVQSSTTLMKLSFDEDHRNTMCLLGGIHTLADLIQTDYVAHGMNQNPDCIIIRRYSGMTLTNLTFGDGTNKALLCSMKEFMSALVAQLDCQNEDICQVTASVLRNLSWHADSASRASLRDSDVVTKLTNAAIRSSKESTLKATLSALWNLSAHSVANKTAICRSPNAISFLIGLLSYKSKTLTIVENAGGILRNIATTIINDDETREIFRSCGLIDILLDHLKSSSLTVVSNACGMLWHLSAKCEQDQRRLLELGAIPKLKALMYSKHERIAQGASAALKNLLNYACEQNAPPSPPSAPSAHHPMDLRTSNTTETSIPKPEPPLNLVFQEEPLDLSLHSTKSSPIHVVSAVEFGNRPAKPSQPTFFNPHLQEHSTRKYYSREENYNSCPELVRFECKPAPAHTAGAIDFSKNNRRNGCNGKPDVPEDSTINYSLHYTESDECRGSKSEDTVKTYYCEGTPLNFSTSNSMSDLTAVEKPAKLKPIIEATPDVELPQKYCTEHTPATFSRASSLSSIASNIQGGENKAEYFEETPLKSVTTSTSGSGTEKEKVKRNVTFSANETPLMFSRSSSINSLDSVEITYEDGGSVVSEFSRRPSEVVSPSDLPDSPRQMCAPESSSRFTEKQEKSMNRGGTGAEQEEDTVKYFNSCESGAISGVISVRSLSPLMVDGEPVGVKMKLDSSPPPKPSVSAEESKEASTIESQPRSQEVDEITPRVFAVEGTPFGASNATSLSDLVGELDKEDDEKPQPNAASEEKWTPPIQEEEEPIYSDAQMLQKCIKAGKAARIPKSKSEFSKLNTATVNANVNAKEIPVTVKTSQSYHENLKPSYIDPELAALIQEGKCRARGIRRPPRQDQSTKVTRLGSEPALKVNKVNKEPEVKKPEIVETPKEEERAPLATSILQSTTSIASEWNDETPTISSPIPSMSISTAFRIVEKAEEPKGGLVGDELEDDLLLQSTLSKIEPPSGFSTLLSSVDSPKKMDTTESSNLFNQKPPEFDLESSMISVASLKSEVASLAAGVKDLSIGGETYTIGCIGSDGDADAVTDAEDSLVEEVNSLEEILVQEKPQETTPTISPKLSPERFLTFTKRHSSPRQKRREDPSRYLTRTISPHDSNGNVNTNAMVNQFATFKIDKTSRIVSPGRQGISATSNESSPSASPKGIRGRRKHLYASLPPQKKVAPPIPPKPLLPSSISNNAVFVRPTRTSALRAATAAGSQDSSSKHSSKNSSSSSLNNFTQPNLPSTRKTPPKPPVRTTLSSPSKNFAVVRAVRNSNSSIGFSNESRATDIGFNTLPRSTGGILKPAVSEPTKVGNIGKLSNLWNQLTKSKTDNTKSSHDHGIDKPSQSTEKKSSKFGFSFGKKKKDVWLKREDESSTVKEKVEREKAFVLPFNYNNHKKQPEPSNGGGSSGGNSKMTTV